MRHVIIFFKFKMGVGGVVHDIEKLTEITSLAITVYFILVSIKKKVLC